MRAEKPIWQKPNTNKDLQWRTLVRRAPQETKPQKTSKNVAARRAGDR